MLYKQRTQQCVCAHQQHRMGQQSWNVPQPTMGQGGEKGADGCGGPRRHSPPPAIHDPTCHKPWPVAAPPTSCTVRHTTTWHSAQARHTHMAAHRYQTQACWLRYIHGPQALQQCAGAAGHVWASQARHAGRRVGPRHDRDASSAAAPELKVATRQASVVRKKQITSLRSCGARQRIDSR